MRVMKLAACVLRHVSNHPSAVYRLWLIDGRIGASRAIGISYTLDVQRTPAGLACRGSVHV